ncbi:hypothetical protein COCVIDRAFT_109114 [Bipolaris victoriae FI3]|uniref:Uncharacterized protein n=2 Tax=Bipolaris TaxID=33194 RepID=W6YDR3_COCC2|nr:uncharacterized protein COCCADRAFT_90047 [Bipolaris zeicola 26-R-13]XP_014552872.1 hypothetical protein COCVIDRAFT_109114 [Bipolaris victoriae FI3]EUC35770.1 hypothetical protein COCCADRAFT_90047 [Bipolaris zeicola 26-R-13]
MSSDNGDDAVKGLAKPQPISATAVKTQCPFADQDTRHCCIEGPSRSARMRAEGQDRG